MMAANVYILECADGTYYTGWTNQVEQRLLAHNKGAGARYTRGRLPVRLAYVEEWPNKQSAQRREAAIKRLDRRQKIRLMETAANGN